MTGQANNSPAADWCPLNVPSFEVLVHLHSGACIDHYTVSSTKLAGKSLLEIEKIVRRDAPRRYGDGCVFVVTGNAGVRSSCQVQMTLTESD